MNSRIADIDVDVRDRSKHHPPMMTLLVLAAAAGSAGPPTTPPLCVPVASDNLRPTTSDIEEHKKLRQALNEPMPEERQMVMLHGKGGHLSTEEYSIIVARSPDGQWRGTAVGRRRIAVEGAPFTPMQRAEWVLDDASGKRLNDAISRTCPFDRAAGNDRMPEPPPRGYISEKMDVVSAGRQNYSFYVGEGGEAVAALIRPPR